MARRKRKDENRILVEKPEGKKPLGRRRHRCESKSDVRACTGFICFRRGTDSCWAVVNTVMNPFVNKMWGIS